jgi:5-oxoprolinase (ATP-hydrolysing) subunit A
MTLDLNCDLGEGEPLARTRALMRCVTSANVACGGHAGDAASMLRCVRLAREHGVRLGAHPGTWDRRNFGRTPTPITPDELESLLLRQVRALEGIARSEGVPLHHLKLHGALYHATEQDARLARRYLAIVARHWPQAKVYALAGGRVAAAARRTRVTVWEEAFLDRRYRTDGTLVPRTEAGALLTGVQAALRQAEGLVKRGEVIAQTGERIRLKAHTLCLHGDGPRAAQLARAVARLLRAG